jgi:aspartyl-tRNA synthetase
MAFPKNNQGRDVMIGAPSPIEPKQMDELCIASTAKVVNDATTTNSEKK